MFFPALLVINLIDPDFSRQLIILSFEKISDVHFDAVVSLDLLLRQKLSLMQFLLYAFSQLLCKSFDYVLFCFIR